MSWEMGKRRFVETPARVDIDRIDDIVRSLRGIGRRYVRRLVLTRWREEKASIGCKCQSSEEGRESLVGI